MYCSYVQFLLIGRGTVAIGTIQRGEINQGDQAKLIGFGTDINVRITDMEVCYLLANFRN